MSNALRRRAALLLAVTLWSAACADPAAPSEDWSIVISVPEDTVLVAGTMQASAQLLDEDGTEQSASALVWESSNEDVATVDAQGVITGRSAGVFAVRARSGDVMGFEVLSVKLYGPPADYAGRFTLGFEYGGFTACGTGEEFRPSGALSTIIEYMAARPDAYPVYMGTPSGTVAVRWSAGVTLEDVAGESRRGMQVTSVDFVADEDYPVCEE